MLFAHIHVHFCDHTEIYRFLVVFFSKISVLVRKNDVNRVLKIKYICKLAKNTLSDLKIKYSMICIHQAQYFAKFQIKKNLQKNEKFGWIHNGI